MAASAFMLSLLNRQRQLLGPKFAERYPSDWLVWEPGPWHPARSESTSNAEATQLPTAAAPFTRPLGDDALCFELKRVPSELTMGRATDNNIVINDLTVSRAQLQLEFADQKWRVRTKTTVTVDGKPVGAEGTLLKNGASLVIGDVLVTFYERDGFIARLQAPPGRPTVPAAAPPMPTR